MDPLNDLWFYVGIVGIGIFLGALTHLFDHLLTRTPRQEDET